MKTEEPRKIYLKDYRPSPYLIEAVNLDVSLEPKSTRVLSRLKVRPNPASKEKNAPLRLDGENLKLETLALDGRKLNDFRLDDTSLQIDKVPDKPFEIEVSTVCDPEGNAALEGLYRSRGIYCTQCEPEGFRKITYFIDRPDILARFRVRLEADKKETPVLLANGNLVEQGDLKSGRHYAVWEDPFPKPSYLFAMVGGDLACVRDKFTTRSGRAVELRIYVEPGKEGRCGWAMESLKKAMRWDEERFGLEYDLDIFMIVAVSDFNMGAMENKGLNVFNDKLILARPDIATDADYESIEAVIAHEYFHNWTGNRVTCRDWFQLCLKEGLTVFRDQEFTSDVRSRPVKRIEDVRLLRARQFAEDGGPLAHPVRPDSFIEINNFYTLTVYEKGAELCRMLHTMLGEDGFQRGMKLYFERHDGQAVTVEDFVAAMADANGTDLDQFMRWYTQAGTPELTCRLRYSPKDKSARLSLRQFLPPTPGQSNKKPVPIPIKLGLLGAEGEDLPLKPEGGRKINDGLLILTEASQDFVFEDVRQRPVPSLLRGFSAPVKLVSTLSERELEFLMRHDSDLFNRWQAAQTLAMNTLVNMTAAIRGGRATRRGSRLARALAATLADDRLEPAYRATFAALPSERDIAQEIGKDVDPAAIHEARERLRARLGRALRNELEVLYTANEVKGEYSPDPDSAGRRGLRNTALALLAAGGGSAAIEKVRQHYLRAANMTDTIAALSVLTHLDTDAREEAFADFARRWKDEPLVMDKWFALQAHSSLPDTPKRVAALKKHELFSIKNPNRVRALIGAFAMNNPLHFNAPDGRGYEFVAEAVLEIDAFNPMIAARLAGAFSSWRILEPRRRKQAKKALQRIAANSKLSRDTREIVGKMLA